MRAIRLTIAYDGTRYVGWQVQPNGPSIQAALEEAVNHLTGEMVRVQGAGRTDSGVHARGQVALFQTESSIPTERFARALNSRLPDDIAVRAAEEVAGEFDPRRHAKRKLYRYTLARGPIRPVLDRHFCWHVVGELDVPAMAEAAKRLEGTHDFTSFSHQECNEPDANNIRTIDRSELIERGERLVYEVEGRSFLYNMVRNIVGTLVDVGHGRFSPADIPRLLEARDRQQAGQGAPARGLCLVWVRYS